MEKEQSPAEHINALYEERSAWSDEEILAELRALPVLPDEHDPAWNDERTWREHADLFVALADVAATRRLRAAAPLLLERACYGDPGEMMRGLRNNLEGIFEPDWDALTDVCMQAAKYPQRGARLWAVDELAVLREPRSLQTLIEALDDEAEQVRIEACRALMMVCQDNEGCRKPAMESLKQYLSKQRGYEEQRAGQEALDDIEKMMQAESDEL